MLHIWHFSTSALLSKVRCGFYRTGEHAGSVDLNRILVFLYVKIFWYPDPLAITSALALTFGTYYRTTVGEEQGICLAAAGLAHNS